MLKTAQNFSDPGPLLHITTSTFIRYFWLYIEETIQNSQCMGNFKQASVKPIKRKRKKVRKGNIHFLEKNV